MAYGLPQPPSGLRYPRRLPTDIGVVDQIVAHDAIFLSHVVTYDSG